MEKAWRGVVTAMVTPFTKNGELDEDGLRQNARFQLAEGVDGVLALGTTGEPPTLSENEKRRVVTIVKEEIGDTLPLMVGVGTNATASTLENMRWAKELGADMGLVVTPYYNKPTQEGIVRHFETLAEGCDLPMCLYNAPGRTGTRIHVETMRRLCRIESVKAIKESTGDFVQMAEIRAMLNEVRPDIALFTGDDPNIVPTMSIGGVGVISVASNLVPRIVGEIVRLYREGEVVKSRELFLEYLPLFRGLFLESNPIPVKAAMNEWGLAAGPCRLPLCEMRKENLRKLREVLEQKRAVLA